MNERDLALMELQDMITAAAVRAAADWYNRTVLKLEPEEYVEEDGKLYNPKEIMKAGYETQCFGCAHKIERGQSMYRHGSKVGPHCMRPSCVERFFKELEAVSEKKV